MKYLSQYVLWMSARLFPVALTAIFPTVVVAGTTTEFQVCGVSVDFSGSPSEVPIPSNSPDSETYGITGSGWAHSTVEFGKFSTEMAYCMCPKEPMRTGLLNEVRKVSRWNRTISGLGASLQSPILDASGKSGYYRTYTVSPDTNTRCFLYMMVTSDGDKAKLQTASDIFFDSVRVAHKPDRLKESPIERLKQLQLLRDQGLITDAEYEARRKAVVESL